MPLFSPPPLHFATYGCQNCTRMRYFRHDANPAHVLLKPAIPPEPYTPPILAFFRFFSAV